MKELIIIMTLIFISNCKEAVKPKPFHAGSCVQERSRFVASFSDDAFETYLLKNTYKNGYHLYRYNKSGKPMYYRWLSFSAIRKRNLSKIECPNKTMKLPFQD